MSAGSRRALEALVRKAQIEKETFAKTRLHKSQWEDLVGYKDVSA